MTIQRDLPALKKPIRGVISNRFTFGVPLEDIFPANDIHSQLKHLFGTIFEKFRFTYNLEALHHILRYEQGSKLEKERTVEALELCKSIDHLHIGLLLWVSKSFFQCLPIPVLPFYTNGEFFNWIFLAKTYSEYTLKKKHNYNILMQIIENLLRLPAANLLLLDYLVNLLRKLTIRDGLLKQRVNKMMLVMLVKYYATAIFENRSYFNQKEQIKYSPLLYYVVMNWKVINYFIKQHKLTAMTMTLPQKQKPTNNEINKTPQISRVPLQTIYDDEILTSRTQNKTTQVDNLTKATFINSQSQTDNCEDLKTTSKILTDASTQCESDFENDDIYYTPAKEEVNKKSNSYEEVPTPPPKRHTITDKLHCLQSSQSSQEDDPYIYDDYTEQMLIATVSNDSFDMDDTDVFLSLDNTKVEQDKSQDDIKAKVTKLGWTYTPSINDNHYPSKVNVFSPRAFTEIDKNLPEYKIYFDPEDKNGINEDKMDSTKPDVPPGKSLLRDAISSGSMKVKLEFLRILGRRRDLKLKSNSSQELTSKIKYKKMNSTRSNMF